MSRFADPAYVESFKESGAYPDIHRAMFDMVSAFVSGVTAVDLGACTGLLAHHLLEAGVAHKVLAIEGNLSYIARGVNRPGLDWLNARVKVANIPEIAQEISDYGATCCTARRVLPEIGPAAVRCLAEAMHIAGVEWIFVEGRIVSGRSNDPLLSLDRELACLMPWYSPVKIVGRVAAVQAV